MCRFLFYIPFLLVGCSSELDRPIRIVIPDDYSGPFVVYAHPDHEDGIVRQSDAYVIPVPDDGVAPVSDLRIFEKWHGYEFVNASGQKVSNVHGGPRSVYSDVEGEFKWFYRGSSQESHEYFYGSGSNQRSKSWIEDRSLR